MCLGSYPGHGYTHRLTEADAEENLSIKKFNEAFARIQFEFGHKVRAV